MGSLIVSAAGVTEPALVLGYSSSRESGNIVHPIIGSDDADVTLRPATLRTGTLELLYLDETASADAEQLHAAGAPLVLMTPDRATVAMTYVPVGRIGRSLDPQTRDRWVLSVDFQEVRPQ